MTKLSKIFFTQNHASKNLIVPEELIQTIRHEETTQQKNPEEPGKHPVPAEKADRKENRLDRRSQDKTQKSLFRHKSIILNSLAKNQRFQLFQNFSFSQYILEPQNFLTKLSNCILTFDRTVKNDFDKFPPKPQPLALS